MHRLRTTVLEPPVHRLPDYMACALRTIYSLLFWSSACRFLTCGFSASVTGESIPKVSHIISPNHTYIRMHTGPNTTLMSSPQRTLTSRAENILEMPAFRCPWSWCVRLLTARLKHDDQKHLVCDRDGVVGRGDCLSQLTTPRLHPPQREVGAGTRDRNLESGGEAEAWRNSAYWLAPHGLLSPLS